MFWILRPMLVDMLKPLSQVYLGVMYLADLELYVVIIILSSIPSNMTSCIIALLLFL